ncbi:MULTISPECIES: TetR/AcrR family transcriptional regulator [Agrobacterium]|uniref:TetR/AcrR family transcriptional regulator n=1 Tax=Agrobacterium TaxID=357 RepID=UPI002301D2F3|nr:MULTISPECIES: TetR/AcrR family transcriptional regulator [Agrobacterium]MDA5638691.1 TetR/AcrR family transcriptional regulator [Agrobacterium sp. ST15.13.013]MDA7000600.1 TetR/AcrR family transcriptional regulator [Agrobacterium salinitolerans]
MSGQSATRTRLISEGMRQLLAHGYEGVGIGPVLKEVNVPKGSFYYFFASKDDFVVAVIEAYEQKYARIRERLFSDTSLRALQRLSVYFETLELELKQDGPYAGCLYGVIAQTAAGRSTLVRDALVTSFRRWETSMRELLMQAQYEGDIAGDEDISDLCACIIEAYEGALIRVKATGDIGALTRFRTRGLKRLMAQIQCDDRLLSGRDA